MKYLIVIIIIFMFCHDLTKKEQELKEHRFIKFSEENLNKIDTVAFENNFKSISFKFLFNRSDFHYSELGFSFDGHNKMIGNFDTGFQKLSLH